MKNKLIILSAVLALVFALCGCGGSFGSGETPSAPPVVIESPENSAPVTEPQGIAVELATDEILDEYDEYESFIEFLEEGYQKIVFTSDVTLKDFKFFVAELEEKEKEFILSAGEVLYETEELTAEKPIVITWMDIGLIPQRGISFTDQNGETKTYFVTTSGMDGSIILIEN